MTDTTSTQIRTRSLGRVNRQTPHDVDFGMVDSKGRRIGARVHTYEETYEDLPAGSNTGWYSQPAGHYFGMTVSATRNGQHFGATQSAQYFATEALRDAAALKYLTAARKRAAKLAAPATIPQRWADEFAMEDLAARQGLGGGQ